MIENKKAQNLSITTIILIILGVAVLVVLILGFTQGWGTLKGWISPSSGVKSVCSVACAAENTYDWCTKEHSVDGGKMTCDTISGDTNNKYGVVKCNAIPTCPSSGDNPLDEEAP